jgi:hypothetical protein
VFAENLASGGASSEGLDDVEANDAAFMMTASARTLDRVECRALALGRRTATTGVTPPVGLAFAALFVDNTDVVFENVIVYERVQ